MSPTHVPTIPLICLSLRSVMRLRTNWVIAAAVVLHLSMVATVGCTQETAEIKKNRHKEQAAAYFEKGQYREAVIELKNVVKIAPTDGDAHYRIALTYLKLGTLEDLQQAFQELSTALQLDASNKDAHLQLGNLLLFAHEPAKAREQADIVLAGDPGNKEGLILRGRSLLSERKLEEGIAELKKSLELDRENIGVPLDLARAYMDMKDFKSAETTLAQALTVNPRSSEIQIALGDLQLVQGKHNLAELEYKKAVELAPDKPQTNLKLAGIYILTKRFPEAEATYAKWAQVVPQDEHPLIAVGDYYQVIGQLDKARDSFQKAIARNPKSLEARDRLITFLIDTEKLDEAETRTKAILDENSKDISGRLFDGRLKVARGQMVEAIKVLLPLSNEQPRLSGPHHFLGMAYAAQANVSEAIKEFREAIRRDPNAFQSHVALGAAYLSKGDPDGAIEETQIALRLTPENVQATLLLGESYWRKRDMEKSRQVFQAIVKALPQHALAHYRLGLIARTQQKDTEALAHFEQALKPNPNYVDPLTQIVGIKLGQGKATEARERLIQHQGLVPKNASVQMLLGQFYVAQKQYDLAETAFKKTLELNEGVSGAYTSLAALYMRSGKIDQAVAEYETALKKNPKLVPAIMVLGMIDESRKEYDKAQAQYQKVLQINPRFAPAANNLAWLMVDRGGNLDVALGYAETAREVAPYDPTIADTLGWIYFKKNVLVTAVSLLKESSEKLPDNPVVWYHLGMALHKTGDQSGAKNALEQALRLNPDFPGAEEAKRTIATLSGSSQG